MIGTGLGTCEEHEQKKENVKNCTELGTGTVTKYSEAFQGNAWKLSRKCNKNRIRIRAWNPKFTQIREMGLLLCHNTHLIFCKALPLQKFPGAGAGGGARARARA